ncbi:hypothetical protein ACHAWF_010103 [Thalassiosira exigua]
MSRHRNIRNLDEDDYYDDYYDDEDDYYLEQQREKERKQKEEAARKAKENQRKQQQQQQQQQHQQQKQQQQAKGAAKKKVGSTGGISVASGNKGAQKGIASGISSASPATKPPLGLSVEPAKKRVAWSADDAGGTCSSADASPGAAAQQQEAEAPAPTIPPDVLAALRSLNGGADDKSSAGGSAVRSHLSMIVLGHVDAGKSTLTGRLLLSLRHVSRRQLEKHQRSAAAVGKSSFALAWFADESESERERGVTVDVATKFARTEKFDFTLLDAPGHRDFVPNMIAGTASADAGLLVVAATTGEFEAGFAGGGNGGDSDGGAPQMCGQTREHIILSRGLGVTQFVVAVNKLDAADPAWSRERFEHIKSMVLDFLKQKGFKEKRIAFVPVSGLTGVNVMREGKVEDEAGWRQLQKWYKGPTLVEALNGFMPAKREFEKPLRVVVTDVTSEGKNVTVRGRVVQGFIRAGDEVVILPVGDAANVVRVERGKASREGDSPYSFASPTPNGTAEGKEREVEDIPGLQNCALAGDVAEVTLSGIDPARLSPGCIASHPHPSLRPPVERRFEARVLVMDRLAVPIIRGSQVLLHMQSVDVPAILTKLVSSERRGERVRQNPRVLTGGVTATVEVTLSERLVIEESSKCKSLGRFVLRRGGDTIAVGLIDQVLN